MTRNKPDIIDDGRAPRVTMERLCLRRASDCRALMLAAYTAHPDAFTSSVAEREKLPLSWWEARLSSSPDAKELALVAKD